MNRLVPFSCSLLLATSLPLFAGGCVGQPEPAASTTLSLTGEALHLDSLEDLPAATGVASRIDVGGQSYTFALSNTTGGPVLSGASEDGKETLTIQLVGDELNVSATSNGTTMTMKTHNPAGEVSDLSNLRQRIAQSDAVQAQSETVSNTLPLAVFVAQSWGSSPNGGEARTLLDALTTSLADWSADFVTSGPPASGDFRDLKLVNEPDGPSCSAGGSTFSCSSGSTCTSNGSGCSCKSS